MTAPGRILFVAHDSSRSGGTLFLLNMLRWLRDRTALQFDVALRHEGEMLSEFQRVCGTYVLHPGVEPASGRCRRVQEWWDRRRRDRALYRDLQALLDTGRYDLLYLNTITLGDHLARLRRLPVPVVTHVHELAWSIRRYAHGLEDLVLQRSDQVICVSDAVRDHLVAAHGVPPDKARRVYGFVPQPQVNGTAVQRRDHVLARFGIPPGASLLGLCGHADLRKGADLVVPLARLLPPDVNGRPMHLIWVGSHSTEYPLELALSDARRAGVDSRVHFAGPTLVPGDWLSVFDLHLSLAREDPFPLVVMEAAALGVPTIAFRGAGGAAEFIGDEAGVCVPDLDLPALATSIVHLLADTDRRRALGEAARRRCSTRHAPDVVLPEIVRVIDDVLGQSKQPTVPVSR